jgi:hypothetical protein
MNRKLAIKKEVTFDMAKYDMYDTLTPYPHCMYIHSSPPLTRSLRQRSSLLQDPSEKGHPSYKIPPTKVFPLIRSLRQRPSLL